MTGVGLISPEYKIFDGTQNADNYTAHNGNLWTYNTGIFLLGSAAIYNYVSYFGTKLLLSLLT
jgi:mannan endo-1,6-alpha-mannosidase